MPSPCLLFTFLLILSFSLATRLQLWFQNWTGNRLQSGSVLKVLLGDGRRLFAHHFFIRADVYFHGGYYPSVFDRPPEHPPGAALKNAGPHVAQAPETLKDLPDSHPPATDWIARFGRYFVPSEHIHLDQPSHVGEILPWLWLSAELDPNRVQTYTVAAFWLRRMGKVGQAEQFLRQGWRANPDSAAILLELGALYDADRHDPARARNLWVLALRMWQAQSAANPNPDPFLYDQIAGNLARLEERAGDFKQAILYYQMLKPVSPDPMAIQKHIDELQQKLDKPN